MINLKYLILIVWLLPLSATEALSQKIRNPNFKIYVQESRYNKETIAYLQSHNIFRNYKYLGEYMIDPRKRGIYDANKIISRLNMYFPQNDATGFLSLNIEGKIYRDLMNNDKNTKAFKNAEAEFIKIIDVIKKERPNVKVGIYGLPYRFYYSHQKKVNANNKLDNLLSRVDYISPSLYVVYPDREKGFKANENYIINNLRFSLEVGKRLGKPVIPYVWHFIHPTNKRFGGSLVDRNELTKNIQLIANYSFNGYQASGVIWWESSTSSFDGYLKRSNQKGLFNGVATEQNSLIRYYTESLINNF